MRRLVYGLLAVSAGAVAVSSAGLLTAESQSGSTVAKTVPTSVQLHRRVVRVAIRNFAFVPARVVVSAGTRVIWANGDMDPHTVTSNTRGGGLSSRALDTGGQFASVVRHRGTIAYHCTIHPYMHGVVVVAG